MAELDYANRLRANQQADRKEKQTSYNQRQAGGFNQLPGLKSPEEFAARGATSGAPTQMPTQTSQGQRGQAQGQVSKQDQPQSAGSRVASFARRVAFGKQFQKGIGAGLKAGASTYAKTAAKSVGKWIVLALVSNPIGWVIIGLLAIVFAIAILSFVGCNAFSGWDYAFCKGAVLIHKVI